MRNIEANILRAGAVIGIGASWWLVDSINKPVVDPGTCTGSGRQVIKLDGGLSQDAKVVESLQNPNNPDCGNITTTLRDTPEGSVITSVISHPSNKGQITYEIGPEYYNPREKVVIQWTDGGELLIVTLDGLPAYPRRE